MQFPITIGLRRSFFAGSACFGVSVLSAITVGFTAWPNPTALIALVLLGFASAIACWRLMSRRVSAIRLERGGQLVLRLTDEAQTEVSCSLLSAHVHPLLAVIRCQDELGIVRLLAFYPDSAAKEDLRRLRVFLRWRANLKNDDV